MRKITDQKTIFFGGNRPSALKPNGAGFVLGFNLYVQYREMLNQHVFTAQLKYSLCNTTDETLHLFVD